jgi:hypothetical protein
MPVPFAICPFLSPRALCYYENTCANPQTVSYTHPLSRRRRRKLPQINATSGGQSQGIILIMLSFVVVELVAYHSRLILPYSVYLSPILRYSDTEYFSLPYSDTQILSIFLSDTQILRYMYSVFLSPILRYSVFLSPIIRFFA